MPEANIQITRRVLEELFDKGNFDALDELIHPDFVNHEAPPDNPQGPDGLKETVSWLRGLWGPMRAEIEDEICEGDCCSSTRAAPAWDGPLHPVSLDQALNLGLVSVLVSARMTLVSQRQLHSVRSPCYAVTPSPADRAGACSWRLLGHPW